MHETLAESETKAGAFHAGLFDIKAIERGK
jgi:hypothetical protein